MNLRPLARITGNAGIFFTATVGGTALSGAPDVEIALWVTLLGMIASASREVVEYGESKRK